MVAWPYQHLFLEGKAFGERVEYAQLLHDGSEVTFDLSDWHAGQAGGVKKDSLVINLPQKQPNVTLPVVELFLK